MAKLTAQQRQVRLKKKVDLALTLAIIANLVTLLVLLGVL